MNRKLDKILKVFTKTKKELTDLTDSLAFEQDVLREDAEKIVTKQKETKEVQDKVSKVLNNLNTLLGE